MRFMDWRLIHVGFARVAADLRDEEVDPEWCILVYQEALDDD